MIRNAVKHTLQDGGTAIGTMVYEFNSSGIGRIVSAAGADFVVFDMEHSGWTTETIRNLIATSRSVPLVPMVRPPTAAYHFVAGLLDVGAAGLMMPFIDTPDLARLVVQSARYAPAGRRGASAGVAHDDYVAGDIRQEFQTANDEVLIVVQVETMEGLNNLDAIAAVEGVDVVCVGPLDMSVSLGIPADFSNPKFIDALERVAKACAAHGKAPGMVAMSVDHARQLLEMGFRWVAYSGDGGIYAQALHSGIDAIKSSIPVAR